MMRVRKLQMFKSLKKIFKIKQLIKLIINCEINIENNVNN